MKFLHRLDALEDRVMLVETDINRLKQASFLDGREQFWSSSSVESGSSLTGGALGHDRGTVGWIFHVGFCGSTLLTRLLESSCEVLSLREPQCLVDLSDQLAQARTNGKLTQIERWLNTASAHFAALPGGDRKTIVKPSNWANSLLPLLESAGLLHNALFVTMERRAWLHACVRGGRDRLAYVARCADHAVRADANGAHMELLKSAITGTADPIDQAVRLAALLYELQNAGFDRVDPLAARTLDYAEIARSPADALHKAQTLLGISAIPSDPGIIGWHAKDPKRRFDKDAREQEDRAVNAEHSDRIDAAMAWIDDEKLPQGF
jgi:hypothetical protein